MSHLNAEHRLFIDGALVDAQDGQTYEVINPATEEVAGVEESHTGRFLRGGLMPEVVAAG